MFIHMSSSICHAFTTVVTPVAGTGCRKSCYPTFISTYQLRETAPETHIPKSRNLAELFRIQTYCSLTYHPLTLITTAPFPLPQAFCPSRTNLVQNRREAAAIPSFKVHEWSRKTLEENATGYGREEAVSAPLSDLPSLS